MVVAMVQNYTKWSAPLPQPIHPSNTHRLTNISHLSWEARQLAVFAIYEPQVPVDLAVEEAAHGEQVGHGLYVRPHVLARHRTQDAQRRNRRVNAISSTCNTAIVQYQS